MTTPASGLAAPRPRLLVSLGAYTLLGFVPMATNLVVVPVYLRYLTVAEYGVVGLANFANTFVQLAVGLGLVEAYDRQYFEKKFAGGGAGTLLGTVLVGLAATTAALAAVFALGGGPLFRAVLPSLSFEDFGWWLLLFAVGAVLQSVMFLTFRNAENLPLAALSSLVPFLGGTVGIFVGIAPLHGGARGAIAGRAVGYMLGLLPGLVFTVGKARLRFDRRVLTTLLDYGLPVLAYVVLNNVLFLGDRVLFERWAGLEVLGVYLLAVTILSPAEILANAVTPAVQPRLYRKLAESDGSVWSDMRRIYEALFAVQVILLCVALTFAEPVVGWLGRDGYVGSTAFLPIIAVGQLFRVRYFYFSLPLFFFKRTRVLPLMTAGSILVGAVSAWLGNRYFGPVGIAGGVVAWKFSQQAAAHWFVVRERLSPDMGLPRSTALTALFIAYFVADAWIGSAAVRWGGAAVLASAAAVVLVPLVKGRA